MRRLALIVPILGIAGCASVGESFERLARLETDQAKAYCQWPYHHRLAAYTWIAGDLAAVNITWGGIICPGDPEDKAE